MSSTRDSWSRRSRAAAITLGTALVAAVGVVGPMGPAASAGVVHGKVLGPTKRVAYDGLVLRVPKDWAVHDLDADPSTCVRLDRPAVYLGTPGAAQDCPARLVGRAETISVRPADDEPIPTLSDSVPRTITPGTAPTLESSGAESGEATFGVSGTGLAISASFGSAPEVIEAVLETASYHGPVRETPSVVPFGSLLEGFATSTRIPSGGTGTRVVGRGFDTCAAPSVSTMDAWRRSSYETVGIYIGGVNRACPDGNLSARWTRTVAKQGWSMLPIYVGRQAPCAFQDDLGSIRSRNVGAQGRAAAEDAAKRARAFGLRRGSAIFFDMEGYNDTNSRCNKIVLTFLSAWTWRIHQLGYLSGVYSSASSGIKQLSRHYNSGTFARPDVIWTARWDGDGTVWDEPHVARSKWNYHQRVKQFRGPHNETHGGRTLNIDSNVVNAAVASPTFFHRVTATATLNARSGPSTAFRVAGSHSSGSKLKVVCQVAGQRIGSTRVWNRLADGTYVTNAYMRTGYDGFSPKISRCRYPYQVKTELRMRSGPSTKHAVQGVLSNGSLAWVRCQKRGQEVGNSRVWNKLKDGSWVADYYTMTPGRPGFTHAIPRC